MLNQQASEYKGDRSKERTTAVNSKRRQNSMEESCKFELSRWLSIILVLW